MTDERTKPTTITATEFHRRGADAIRNTSGSEPLIVTRDDGRVRAFIFRDATPLDSEPSSKK